MRYARAIAVAAVMLATWPALGQQMKDLGPDLNKPIPGGGPKLTVEQQRSGDFGAMVRTEVPGGAIQPAWDKADEKAGVYRAKWTPGVTLRMRVREGMVSTVALPAWDSVSIVTLADQINFGASRLAQHPGYVLVWTNNPGYDTNLTVVGTSGNIYAFYLRGETWNSKNIPDVVAYVDAGQPMGGPADRGADKSASKEGARAAAVTASADVLSKQTPEWLREIGFNPLQVRHDRTMKGDEAIAPVLIFRDTRFTYLDYGEKPNDWPVAYEVKDKVDVPVRARTSPDGRFMAIETIGPLTLRLGEKVVCITPES